MSRDHTRLRVFHDAHSLALSIYNATKEFPKDEWFGVRLQMRRAAISIPTNIVEGNARRTTRDYCSYINVALGSACELAYLVRLSTELTLFPEETGVALVERTLSVVRQLQRLQDRMELLRRDEAVLSSDRRPKSGDR